MHTSSRRARARAVATLVAVLVALPVLPPPAARAAVAPVHAQPTVGCVPLTARERAAQTVLAGIPGTGPTAEARDIVARHAGAVILMGRNVSDAAGVRALTDDLRAHAPAGLLVAVDEEGGRVSRLGDPGVVTHLPPARSLPSGHTPEGVRALGRRMAGELRAAGVDWDLAPVLDVTGAAPGTVIGDRSFGSDPEVAATYGSAFAAGLADGGVLTAAKHFPGHGRTAVDSHLQLPTVDASLDELRATDLEPFRRAAPALDAVLTAHVLYPALDPGLPASLSPATTALLRDELGFDGALVTDALEMEAIAQRWDLPTAAERAIAAGADVVTVAGPWQAVPAVTDRIAVAVADGRIPAVRLQEAVRRVLDLKGVAPEAATCLLGLPPAAEATAIVGSDGQVYAVVDGVRRPVPDRETLRGEGLAGALARYDQSEVDALPLGPTLPTARRFDIRDLVAGAGPGDAAGVAVRLSAQRFGAGEAERVVVGRADDPADALGGTALAGPDAPLLLVAPSAGPGLRAAVAAEAQRVLAEGGTLYVLGGVDALSDADLGPLAGDPRLLRLGGGDRYATAALVAGEVLGRDGSGSGGGAASGDGSLAGRGATVLLARGDRAVDAVAVGPLAAARGLPVLLTRPDELPDETAAVLRGVGETLVVGGPQAIADAIVDPLPSPRRLAGSGRAATATEVARSGWGRTAGEPGDAFVMVAGGDDAAAAAHGLAVAGWAAAAGAPLLLAGPTVDPATRAYLEGLAYPSGATAQVRLSGTPAPADLAGVGV